MPISLWLVEVNHRRKEEKEARGKVFNRKLTIREGQNKLSLNKECSLTLTQRDIKIGSLINFIIL